MKDGPVEAFLAELEHRLRRHGEAQGRVLAEAGDHLRDLVCEGRGRGLDELDAEREAVERFRSPRDLARALRPARRRPSARVAAAVAVVGIVGALTVAELRDGHPIGVPQTDVMALPPAGKVVGCVARVRANGNRAPGRTPPPNTVVIDPLTGRVLKCEVVAYTVQDPRYGPFVTRPVTFQVALHQ